jgi:hypothetical protein
MVLQNKVAPNGEIIACKMHGQFMGNRGGRIHDPKTRQMLPKRRWASRQWICCLTSFKSRHRQVMGEGYTEVFFLDEVTALSAGHRPCFECRRADALHFAEYWAKAHQLDRPPKAGEMDLVLHQQRLDGRAKRCFEADLRELPDGVMIADGSDFYGLKSGHLLRWTSEGYDKTALSNTGTVQVLTPASIVDVLKAGYKPRWHESAAVSISGDADVTL